MSLWETFHIQATQTLNFVQQLEEELRLYQVRVSFKSHDNYKMLPLKTHRSISRFRAAQKIPHDNAQHAEGQRRQAAQQPEDQLLLLSLPEVFAFRYSLSSQKPFTSAVPDLSLLIALCHTLQPPSICTQNTLNV